MKKALVLTSLAALAAVSFGCALTDYAPNGIAPMNKSHGLIGCESNDRIANAQQTIEAMTRDLLYTTTYGENTTAFGGFCSSGFNPIVSLNNVNHADARDWNRFNANWTFFGEAQVFGVPNGTWLMAGVKDLANGDIRINSLHTDNVGAFSCVGDAVQGRYGGPEGVVYGDMFGRLPGLHIDVVAIDDLDPAKPVSNFCGNIAAQSPDAAASGMSTYWSLLAQAYEGSLAATPITRRLDLGALLSGGLQTVTAEGVDIDVRGQLNADGTWTLSLMGLRNDLASYQAEGTPISVTVNPANGFKTLKVENTSADAVVAISDFALRAGLANREIFLPSNISGLALPKASFMLNEAWLRQYIDDNANPGDGFGG